MSTLVKKECPDTKTCDHEKGMSLWLSLQCVESNQCLGNTLWCHTHTAAATDSCNTGT